MTNNHKIIRISPYIYRKSWSRLSKAEIPYLNNDFNNVFTDNLANTSEHGKHDIGLIKVMRLYTRTLEQHPRDLLSAYLYNIYLHNDLWALTPDYFYDNPIAIEFSSIISTFYDYSEKDPDFMNWLIYLTVDEAKQENYDNYAIKCESILINDFFNRMLKSMNFMNDDYHWTESGYKMLRDVTEYNNDMIFLMASNLSTIVHHRGLEFAVYLSHPVSESITEDTYIRFIMLIVFHDIKPRPNTALIRIPMTMFKDKISELNMKMKAYFKPYEKH